MGKRIYAITHTEAEHHVQGVGGGWYDSALTEKGLTDAQRIARHLQEELGDTQPKIFSSDLRRCKQVAKAIAGRLHIEVDFDERLREMNYGVAGGQSIAWQEDRIKRLPPAGDRLNHRIFEGAETKKEVGVRMTQFVNEILDTQSGNIIVVTHGFAMTFLILAWMKIPVAHMDHGHFRPRPGRVTLLEEDEAFENRSLVFYASERYMEPSSQ